jgi:hypothetical protein
MDRIFVGSVKVVENFRINVGKVEVIDARSEVVIVLFLLHGHINDLFSLFLLVFASRTSIVVRLVLLELTHKFVVLLEELIVNIDFTVFFPLVYYVLKVLSFSFISLESFEKELV